MTGHVASVTQPASPTVILASNAMHPNRRGVLLTLMTGFAVPVVQTFSAPSRNASSAVLLAVKLIKFIGWNENSASDRTGYFIYKSIP